MPCAGKLLWATLFGALLLSTAAWAGPIQVDDAWALHVDQGAETGLAVFMTVTNTGTTPDRLYAAKSRVSKSADLSAEAHGDNHVLATADGGHEHATVVAFEVKPGQILALRHDGNHIMLHDIMSGLQAGDSFSLTLFFEVAGPVKIEVMMKDKGH